MGPEDFKIYKQLKQDILIASDGDIDLNLYKSGTYSMILEFMNKNNITSLKDLLEYIKSSIDNKNTFKKALTYSGSKYFRGYQLTTMEDGGWNELKDYIIPFLTKDRKKLRVWNAGCGRNGEEIYSFLLIMKTYYPDIELDITVTDINNDNLKGVVKAHVCESVYNDVINEDVNFKQWFISDKKSYTFDKDFKSNIKQIKEHNLLTDIYPEGFDLILCRNTIKFFSDDMRENVYKSLSNSLTNNGVIFVGHDNKEKIKDYEFNNLKLKPIGTTNYFYIKNI